MRTVLICLALSICARAQWIPFPGPTNAPTASSPDATPTFSPAAGAISSGTTIAITSSTSGATICYTLNGDTPTATVAGTCDSDSGNEYSIVNGGSTSAITTPLTVKAIATKLLTTNSAVGSAAYTITASGCTDGGTAVAYDAGYRASCVSGCGSGLALGSNWTQASGNIIEPNSLFPTGPNFLDTLLGGQSEPGYARYSNATFANNQYAQIDCGGNQGSGNYDLCGAGVRMSAGTGSTFDGYACMAIDNGDGSTSTMTIYELTNTADASLGTSLATNGSYSISSTAEPQLLECRASGTTITLKWNGSTVLTTTDSTYSSGQAGMAENAGTGGDFIGPWSGCNN